MMFDMTIGKIVFVADIAILLAACVWAVLVYYRVKKSLEEEKKAARKNNTL